MGKTVRGYRVERRRTEDDWEAEWFEFLCNARENFAAMVGSAVNECDVYLDEIDIPKYREGIIWFLNRALNSRSHLPVVRTVAKDHVLSKDKREANLASLDRAAEKIA